ncbi:hypothetical protein LXL04_015594 [Taraxacum kok-saghyz]
MVIGSFIEFRHDASKFRREATCTWFYWKVNYGQILNLLPSVFVDSSLALDPVRNKILVRRFKYRIKLANQQSHPFAVIAYTNRNKQANGQRVTDLPEPEKEKTESPTSTPLCQAEVAFRET